MLDFQSEREIELENQRRAREERRNAMESARARLEEQCNGDDVPAGQFFGGLLHPSEAATALDLALRCIDRLEVRVRVLEEQIDQLRREVF